MSDHACLNEPAFPDDDGLLDPLLADCREPAERLARLGESRIYVPLVPVLTTDEGVVASPTGDRSADMATVMLTGHDGRTALLVFTTVAAVAAWEPRARPVPVRGRDAAQVAVADGASALLLDLGSAEATVVETEDLDHLAAGDRLVRTGAGLAWLT